MEHILLPEKYPGYIARFTKHEYSPCFKNYCTLTDSFFSQLELYPESINAAIESFVDNITASLPRFFGKKLALYDISRFLFLYTVPAALLSVCRQAYRGMEHTLSGHHAEQSHVFRAFQRFQNKNNGF